jgi:hypothetical protein
MKIRGETAEELKSRFVLVFNMVDEKSALKTIRCSPE